MGSTFRFVHCADLHLGGRFRGVSASDPELGKALRESLFGSFRGIVDLVKREHASALVISGDLYDDDNCLPSTRMRLAEMLGETGVPVFICRGNHDARTSWDDSIPYPDNVHEFGDEPESFDVETPGGPFRITGISFGSLHEERNLAAMLRGSPDMFSIGCVHCDVDSVSEGYPYAPCKQTDLMGRNIDYWALGHIHKRNVVSKDPYVVYPGNIQGRSVKETGPKGAYLISVTNGVVSETRFVPTQKFVWKEVSADITGRDLDSLIGSLDIGKDDIVRLTFTGNGGLDSMLRTQWQDVAGLISKRTGGILLEPKVRTSAVAEPADGGMDSAVLSQGMELSRLSGEQLVDLICGHKMAGRHRDFYSKLSEEELHAMVDEAVASVISGRRSEA